MSSHLSVRDERRSRSKSPSGGRDRDRSRDRSHSRDTRDRTARDRSPAVRPERRSSKYEESETESSEEDGDYDRRGGGSKKSSGGGGGRRYEEEEDDRRRVGKKSSGGGGRYKDEDSEEENRYKSKSSKSSRRDREDEDERRGGDSRRGKKRSDEDDEDDRRGGRKERERDRDRDRDRDREKDKPKKKQAYDSDSSESEDEPPSRKDRDRRDAQKALNGYAQPPHGYPPGYAPPPHYANGHQDARHMSYIPGDPRFAPPPGQYMPPPAVSQRPGSFSGPTGHDPRYAPPDQFQYGHRDDPRQRYPEERERERPRKDKKYEDDSYERRDVRKDDRHDRDDERRNERRDERKDERGDRDRKDRKEKQYHADKYGSSPEEVTKRLGKLGVGAAAGGLLGVAGQHAMGGGGSGGKPPASPLLEAYKGTYQSMSPMPSALVLRDHKDDSDLSDLDLDSDSDIDPRDPNADLKRKIKKLELEKERHEKENAKDKGRSSKGKKGEDIMEITPRSSKDKDLHMQTVAPRGRADSDVSTMIISPNSSRKKRVTFYDADDDARRIAAALEGTHRPPNVKPLIQILPGLSDDDVMALRLSYKNVAKVNGQGINIAKHIKMRVSGNLGKACYATALGRWESEAYWANSWYQGGATRRELLIESLMGRSNSDIREIKNCFKDKRYADDLEKCMKAELKADKFRTAILLALEERRMPESMPLDSRRVMDDVKELYRALVNPGGESAMIQIIVLRSDAHLREVLRAFEKAYEVNFAKAMIEKSRNLVGETLAHVLNGALNRPMRDALLLHQAIAETAPGKERAELLISRLVRLHWEPKHLERVKVQYENRYNRTVEGAIRKEVLAGMKTEEGRNWAEFCVELAGSSS